MLTNSTVTLFCFDEESGNYLFSGSYSAWVHKQSRTKKESGGAYGRDIFDVRIPGSVRGDICPDDIICFDRLYALPEDLKNCNRIAAVTHNRNGRCPHYHIEAENLYR